RTLSPFRERLDAITLACGRTHHAGALGGRKRCASVGECIVADGRPPCQLQPLRGFCRPLRGVNPSTWSVGLRDEDVNRSTRKWPRSVFRKLFCEIPRRLASCAPAPRVRRGSGRYGRPPIRVKASFQQVQEFVTAADATASLGILVVLA